MSVDFYNVPRDDERKMKGGSLVARKLLSLNREKLP